MILVLVGKKDTGPHRHGQGPRELGEDPRGLDKDTPEQDTGPPRMVRVLVGTIWVLRSKLPEGGRWLTTADGMELDEEAHICVGGGRVLSCVRIPGTPPRGPE